MVLVKILVKYFEVPIFPIWNRAKQNDLLDGSFLYFFHRPLTCLFESLEPGKAK